MDAPEPVPLSCREFGPAGAPAVLVLHGLLGSARNWQAIGKQLARRLRVILVDLRNHGASPWSPVMTYPAMAADLAALLDRLDLASAAVVGHSMGGKAALALALTRPERVPRLVVVDIAPVAYEGPGFRRYIEAMRSLDVAHLARRADADPLLAATVPDPAVRAFLLQGLETQGPHLRWQPNLAALLDAMTAIMGFPDELAGRRYEGPTLLIRGERSTYVTADGLAALRACCPATRVLTVRGAGHWVHADAPAIVTGALERFLGE